MDKNETRITDETGGQKCAKLAQMADIPASVLLELMEHYGKGAAKYPGDKTGPNYAKGYKWSLSYNAAMRHSLQFWSGEDIDPETGSKHVIAAAWHMLALALFMERYPEKDDRWEIQPTRLTPAWLTDEYLSDLLKLRKSLIAEIKILKQQKFERESEEFEN